MQEAFVLDGVRTVFGRYGGGLSQIRTDDLAAAPIAELVRRNIGLDPRDVEDVYLGNTNGAGEENRNVGRMAGLLAGLPVEVPGVTVNRLCASGSESLVQAARAVVAGDADLVIGGGVEGMSRAPHVMPQLIRGFPRSVEVAQTAVGWRLVNPKFPESWVRSLGECSEQVALSMGISRREQDEWALMSHQRASAAWSGGLHRTDVMAFPGLEKDESVRPGTAVGDLARLRSAFSEGGTHTAGNSSPLSDGAAAALIGNAAACARAGVEPLGRIVGSATVAVRPDEFALAPAPAVRKLLHRHGLSEGEIHLWEVNEAFAAVVVATLRQLPGVEPSRVNVNGGAIALGHPLGASGARIVLDLLRALRRRGGGVGIAVSCIGVGQGQAVLVEAS